MRVTISVIYDWEKGLLGAKGDKLGSRRQTWEEAGGSMWLPSTKHRWPPKTGYVLDNEVPWKPNVSSLKLLIVSKQWLKMPRLWSQKSKSKLTYDTCPLFLRKLLNFSELLPF